MRTSIQRLLVGGTALFTMHCSGGNLELVVVGDAGDAGDASDEAASDIDGGMDATTGGGPAVVVLPPLMDFGSVPCGTTSALPQSARTVSITSTRQQAFAWVATLARGSSSPYTLSAASGTVAAGVTGTLVVSPLPVPATSATTSGLYGDVLTISTDIPGDAPHTVSLLEDASGAILAFAPAGPLAIGDVPVGSSAMGSFTVVNQGSAPATVVASIAGSPAYTLGDAMLGTVMGNGDSAQGTLSFAPTNASTQSATVSLSVGTGDVLCAPLPHLAVTGQGTNGKASVVPASLDFGLVPCGTAAASQTITLGNTGDAPFDFTAAVAGSNFTVSPAMGTVQPSGTGGMPQTVTVTPVAIPSTSSVAPDQYADVLTITTTSAGDTGHTVPLHMTARGAILQLSTAGLDFGGVPVSTTANAQFTITNTGNAPATVGLVNGLSQFVLSPQGVTIGPSASAPFSGAFKPTATDTYSDSASVTVNATTALCNPLPGPIALSGQGTAGAVAISPVDVDFGQVPCGTQAQAQTVSITNSGAATYTFTALLDQNGQSFYSLGAPSGSVDPGQTFPLTVTPKPIPSTSATTADLYAGTLTITTSVDGAHTVALHETAYGGRLAIDVNQLAFGTIAVGGSGTLPFQITNDGNATVNLALGGFLTPPFTASPSGVPLPGGSSLAGSASFSPQMAGMVGGQSLSIQTSDALCLPLPAPVPMSGTGQ